MEIKSMADGMAAEGFNYSCETRAKTLEWIEAIVDFIKPFSFLMNAHVVNFFKDRLWEAVDEEWMRCLRNEAPENLLLIPSGVFQEYWPSSLKEFICTLRAFTLPREQAGLRKVLPDLHIAPLSSVLSQGMNFKKRHEVEVLSAVVSYVVNSVGAHTVVDVGAGQGYLAQVLSFQYQNSVVAIDACSHHGSVTDARAARIKKHYVAQLRKSGSGNKSPVVPRTVTCRVLSADTLRALTGITLQQDDQSSKPPVCDEGEKIPQSWDGANSLSSVVLAGLHACGDLSVTMLRTFLECTEVKAVVSVGCCYNLLSEEGFNNISSYCGFPMSGGLKSTSLRLGKNPRDLACQSAERWSSLGKDAGLHNFELHAFRAAFQMVLSKHHPDVLTTCPSIGRQGKTFRRQQQRRILESHGFQVKDTNSSLTGKECAIPRSCSSVEHVAAKKDEGLDSVPDNDDSTCHMSFKTQPASESSKALFFEKFSLSAMSRLGLNTSQEIDFQGVWKEAEPFCDLIGPYWSIRAALGPVLETLILLDRLLFLQEQGGSVEAVMLPIFDPALSPRNVAIIAKKVQSK